MFIISFSPKEYCWRGTLFFISKTMFTSIVFKYLFLSCLLIIAIFSFFGKYVRCTITNISTDKHGFKYCDYIDVETKEIVRKQKQIDSDTWDMLRDNHDCQITIRVNHWFVDFVLDITTLGFCVFFMLWLFL